MISSLTIVSRRGLGLQYTRFLSTSYTSKANQVALSLPRSQRWKGTAFTSEQARRCSALESPSRVRGTWLHPWWSHPAPDQIRHKQESQCGRPATTWGWYYDGNHVEEKKTVQTGVYSIHTYFFFCPPPMECCASIEREPVFNCPVLSWEPVWRLIILESESKRNCAIRIERFTEDHHVLARKSWREIESTRTSDVTCIFFLNDDHLIINEHQRRHMYLFF